MHATAGEMVGDRKKWLPVTEQDEPPTAHTVNSYTYLSR